MMPTVICRPGRLPQPGAPAGFGGRASLLRTRRSRTGAQRGIGRGSQIGQHRLLRIDDVPCRSLLRGPSRWPVARLEAALRARLLTARPTTRTTHAPPAEDHYLTIAEVKARTGLSLSYLYEATRTGDLPVRAMGRGRGGTKPRGYRVLLSELVAWEARRATHGLDARLS